MRTSIGIAFAAIVMLATAYSYSPRETAASQVTVNDASRMQVNAIVRTKAGLIAGGELGKIFLSHDDGRSWLPAHMATQRQALITQMVFAGNGTGIAVGHEGWILRSTDDGQSWQEQHFDDKDGEPLMSAARLPSGRWIAVGAFGRMLQSDDDGKTWRSETLPGVDDKHLNNIVGSADGSDWLILGERGLLLESHDGGQQWNLIPAFYNGSFYGAARVSGVGGVDGKRWVIYGMRGHVYFRNDGDSNWTASRLPVMVSVFGAAHLPDGRLLLSGEGGLVMVSNDGESFQTLQIGGRAAVITMEPMPDGSLLLGSTFGLKRLPAPVANIAGITASAATTPNNGVKK
ncbi:Photosynthesis system II assembly factor YCF48 [Collimonas sp. OK607]|uniref:YCF48-related protein n=1 Tax=Collimonas sp. OK607 TaxID=1798194 RepID=UPI0008E890B2|nr:YCF48-related protein [Collimonas sp. OK607]SFA82645.1 Photosynthesis system II assembly factor YCF48 [Collimonas sp. OK607]